MRFFDLFETVGLTEDYTFGAGNCAAVKWTGRRVGKRKQNPVTFRGIDLIFVNGSMMAVPETPPRS